MTPASSPSTSVRTELGAGGAVATVSMARPEVHNAFDDSVVSELTRAFERIAEDDGVRVILLAGDGRSFSAGADLRWMRRMVEYTREENIGDALALARLFERIERSPKPVIARVHGAALGGGAGLVAAADIAIAAEQARFGFSEVRLGIAPAVISPYVVRRIGAGHARRYFATGERFDAERACAIGLVSEVVPATELDTRVRAIADEILRSGPRAVSAAKELVFAAGALDDDRLRDHTARVIADLRAGAEGQEGMRAFLEKRPAPWIEASS